MATVTLNNISNAYIGNNQISEIWLGPTKIWPSHDYSQDYFTIESLEDDNTIRLNMVNITDVEGGTYNNPITVYYSTDNGSTWRSVTSSKSDSVIITVLNTGDKVLLRGTSAPCDTSGTWNGFYGDKQHIVYGNLMSLIYDTNFINQIQLNSRAVFSHLFYNNHNLISAENLVLPATILTEACYMEMFHYCDNLVSAPKLPATVLIDSCYYMTFSGCSSLNSITCYATDISARSCLYYWLYGVSSTGTLYKNANTTYPSGANGIPSGWTIQNL